MVLFRPWRSGRVDDHEVSARFIGSRGLALSRRCARYCGSPRISHTASESILLKGLYLLLAIIVLHDIFAPHPFAPSLILSDGNLSLQAIDESHPSAAEYFEDDENTSFPNRRGTLLPTLSVNCNSELHSCFHPLLLIAADERPPKA
jgi:hypothetical protein